MVRAVRREGGAPLAPKRHPFLVVLLIRKCKGGAPGWLSWQSMTLALRVVSSRPILSAEIT